MALIVKAPNSLGPIRDRKTSLFLAGSIEMGQAGPWQKHIEELFQDNHDLVILNPRRDDWDSSWVQSIENEQFNTQVSWELSGLERSSVVGFWFEPETKSPITLMELGLVAAGAPHKAVVGCPHGFWRRGNIEIVCDRYEIPLLDSFEDFKASLLERINGK